MRSNIRGEDVRIYRLRMTPENARLLLREYLAEANELARRPRFYNTLTSNCATPGVRHGEGDPPQAVVGSARPPCRVSAELRLFCRATETRMPFERLRELSRIRDKALRADADPDFPARIREGIPIPQ